MLSRILFIPIVPFLFTLPAFCSEDAGPMTVHVRRNVAHRGASHLAPENTLTAYKIAISAGANAGECDVWRTVDGVLFLTHETQTGRKLAGGDGRAVTELNSRDLSSLDAGIWKGKQFKGEKVPTLEEYLVLLKGTDCFPFIHIKQSGFEAEIVDMLRKHDLLDVTTITCNGKSLQALRRLEPKLCVSYCFSSRKKEDETAEQWSARLAREIPELCRSVGTTIIHMQHTPVDEALVLALKKENIHVWCWIVNDPKRMKQLLDWGVESITTDRPELFSF